MREIFKHHGGQFQYPNLTNKVRATFVMSQANVQRLKNLVSTRQPTSLHVSSFTVTCAYIWVCIVKSHAVNDKEVAGENELEAFIFMADCHAGFEPPIPKTSFGNCFTACFLTTKNRQLVAEEGFLTTIELIGEAINKRARNQEEVLKLLEAAALNLEELKSEPLVGVAGLPKLGIYGTDFGWGRPIKTEIISINGVGVISLSECRDSEGDLEIGSSFSKIQMDAFATIFADGLESIGICFYGATVYGSEFRVPTGQGLYPSHIRNFDSLCNIPAGGAFIS
ncbi:hypothetical protein F0562_025866 [Nyssa sinensis]|uniref:Uncharacterized protein n=1 Tax=Nyssa sinensis TaxID=561372 RepID=A0A5J5B974_9ASTE|nr:hypothetical protein F0562_025866 [Nyssa sinensis]